MTSANQITGPNAGGPRQLPIRTRWAARVGQFCRSPKNPTHPQSMPTKYKFPEGLVESVRAGLCVPWCGAGVSLASGLPSWRSLCNGFIEACGQNGAQSSELAELQSLAENGGFDDIIEFARGYLGEGQYRSVLSRIVGGPAKPGDVHKRIVKLPFPAIFTTNYDRLLEQALVEQTGAMPTVYTSQESSSLWLKFATKQPFVLKVHGDITRLETVVLTSRDYAEHIFGNLAFMAFLQRVFVSSSVLFIGSSIADGYLRRLLEEITFTTSGVAMPHYAIMKAGPIQKRALRDRLNIRVIELESYSDIPSMLDQLLDCASK
jgi:hypothetical protein